MGSDPLVRKSVAGKAARTDGRRALPLPEGALDRSGGRKGAWGVRPWLF